MYCVYKLSNITSFFPIPALTISSPSDPIPIGGTYKADVTFVPYADDGLSFTTDYNGVSWIVDTELA